MPTRSLRGYQGWGSVHRPRPEKTRNRKLILSVKTGCCSACGWGDNTQAPKQRTQNQNTGPRITDTADLRGRNGTCGNGCQGRNTDTFGWKLSKEAWIFPGVSIIKCELRNSKWKSSLSLLGGPRPPTKGLFLSQRCDWSELSGRDAQSWTSCCRDRPDRDTGAIPSR